MRINDIILLEYNTKLSDRKASYIEFWKNIIIDGRCVIVVNNNAKVNIGERVYFNKGMMISSKLVVFIVSQRQELKIVSIEDR